MFSFLHLKSMDKEHNKPTPRKENTSPISIIAVQTTTNSTSLPGSTTAHSTHARKHIQHDRPSTFPHHPIVSDLCIWRAKNVPGEFVCVIGKQRSDLCPETVSKFGPLPERRTRKAKPTQEPNVRARPSHNTLTAQRRDNRTPHTAQTSRRFSSHVAARPTRGKRTKPHSARLIVSFVIHPSSRSCRRHGPEYRSHHPRGHATPIIIIIRLRACAPHDDRSALRM